MSKYNINHLNIELMKNNEFAETIVRKRSFGNNSSVSINMERKIENKFLDDIIREAEEDYRVGYLYGKGLKR